MAQVQEKKAKKYRKKVEYSRERHGVLKKMNNKLIFIRNAFGRTSSEVFGRCRTQNDKYGYGV